MILPWYYIIAGILCLPSPTISMILPWYYIIAGILCLPSPTISMILPWYYIIAGILCLPSPTISMILYYSGHIMPPLSNHIDDIISHAGTLCLPLKSSPPWHSNSHTRLCQLHKSASATTLGLVPRSTFTAIDIGDSQRIGKSQSGLQSLPKSLPRADVCGVLFTWLVLTTQMDHSYHSQKSQRHAASSI